MFLLTWLVWRKADRIWAYGDTTDVLRIAYGPFVYFMALTLGPGRPHPPLQGGRAPMIEGLVGLTPDDGAVPAARAHLVRHGHRGHRGLRLHARLELDGRLRHRPDQALRDRAQLHAVGGAAVHPDGQLRHAGRHVAGAVPRRLRLHRPPARRPRHGHRVGLGRLRRHLRLVDRHRRHLRQGRLPLDEALRLLRSAGRRRGGRRRHARHHDPALDDHGDLRRLHRDEHRQAVRGRRHARHPGGHPAVRRRRRT